MHTYALPTARVLYRIVHGMKSRDITLNAATINMHTHALPTAQVAYCLAHSLKIRLHCSRHEE